MAKNIVFCADGTWNGPGQPDNDDKMSPVTNVFKLFQNLAGRDDPGTSMLEKEQERTQTAADGSVMQIAKYLHGVGDSDNFLVKALGGTVGAGLIARIVRGYTFISRNYLPGDKIFITGFSRGAYTARALAGMIAAKGLLDASRIDLTDKDAAYRLGSAVWYAYREAALRADASWFDRLKRLQEIVLDLPHFFTLPPPDERLIEVKIEAVAVWDTVGSLGIPQFNLQQERIDAFQFADLVLSPVVQHGFHAIAIDEQRSDFTPTLWQPDTRIVQVLFPGCHSDVGGGFPLTESGLSDCALGWLAEQLAGLGVQFATPPFLVPVPDMTGVAHDPWADPPWHLLVRAARIFPDHLFLSRCAVQRLASAGVINGRGAPRGPYAPTNLTDYLNGRVPAANITVV
jgi:uncharacterized protein (DUF2235 family)